MTKAAQLTYVAKTPRPCAICGAQIAAADVIVRVRGGSAHSCCKARRDALLTSAQASERLGISPDSFRRLVKKDSLQPQAYYDNPRSRSAPKCPLWAPEDIKRLQRSASRSGTLDRIKKRSAAGDEAADTKRAQMSASLEAVHITVLHTPIDELIRQTCNYYNDRQIERFFNRGGGDGLRASPQDDPEFLARITVNFLRHVLSSYEEELARVFGKVGKNGAVTEIRNKVYKAISETYPELAEECDKQKTRRGSVI